MAGPATYTRYHPHWLRPHVSTYWWLDRWSYFLFILREVSSLFVAWTVIVFLLVVAAAGDGAVAYQQQLAEFRTPGLIVLNVIALAFIVLHTVTWFLLAPQAMVVRLGHRRVPGGAIAAAHFAAWAVASAVVIWLVLSA